MSNDKKIVHDLPIEELVKIATRSKEEVIVDKLTEAARFVYSLNIKHGDEKISAQLIYYTYKKWRGWNNKKQPKTSFFKDFKKYFKPNRDKDGMYYSLNSKPFDLSDETFWEMRAEQRNEKAKRRKKSPKQDQNPESSKKV